MTDLPENPTLADICRRSALLHPKVLGADLLAQARADEAYAAVTRSKGAARSARARAQALRDGACVVLAPETIHTHEAWARRPLAVQLVTACAAARIQGLPRHVLTAAAIRTEESRA